MRIRCWTCAALMFVLLAACRIAAEETAVPTIAGLATVPSASPTHTPTLPDPAPSPTSTAGITEPKESLPAPTLFDVSWSDRRPFRSGLVEEEQAVLEALPGATVYHLNFQIAESLTAITGEQEVRYTNQESVPLEAVYFHLFPNLLGGSLTVKRVTVNGESLGTPGLTGNALLLRVPLPEPLLPGDQVVIGLNFETRVPTESGRNYGVFSLLDDILALAHFYPMVAVYDDNGWDTDTPSTEGDVVYADASFYLVGVTAPAAQTLAGGGVEIGREQNDRQQTITYALGPARDFYLAASDRYDVVSQTIDGVTVRSYAPKELRDGAETAVDIARNALRSFSGRFGPYPYTELDIVATPTLALGIEYSGIIVANINIFNLNGSVGGQPTAHFLESTTAHEVGHQWFYSMVGNDQLDEPWLDESLTQYVTWTYYLDRYGKSEAEEILQSFSNRWNRLEDREFPIGLPVQAYHGNEYGAIVYGRGPLFFLAMEDAMGEKAFDAFLRDYTTRFKWGIATGVALKQLAEAHCACDLTPLFEEWVYAP